MAEAAENKNPPSAEPQQAPEQPNPQGAVTHTRYEVSEAAAPADTDGVQATQGRILKIFCHKCTQKLDMTYLEPFSKIDCPVCGIELIVPRWFDNYLLEEKVGIGGMATVYRALDLALDREVAIKVLSTEVAHEKNTSSMFLQEARIAATINHPAVIPIYTCGEYETQPYLVMQYMEGGSIESKLKQARGLLPVPSVLKWIASIADGLDSAARHGIIHHDIKPGNMMLDSEGNAKIGDFGIAQAVFNVHTPELDEQSQCWLSPNYASPEKVATGKEDIKGDVYSLGASFYHLLTGFVPFSHPDTNEVLKMRLKIDPIPPHVQRPEIPTEVSRLVMSMMDRNPGNRPDYKEIVLALNNMMKTTAKKSGRITPPQKSQTLQAPLRTQNPAEQPAPKKRFSKVIMLIELLIIVLVAAAFVAWKTNLLQPYLPEAWTKKISSAVAQVSSSKDEAPELTALLKKGNANEVLGTAKGLLDMPEGSLASKIQVAVQYSIADYLTNDKNAKDNTFFVAERIQAALKNAEDMSALQEPDEKLAVIWYLGKPEIASQSLMDKVAGASQGTKTLATLAILLREIYNGSPADTINNAYRNYATMTNALKPDQWENAWKERVPFWTLCLQNGKGHPEELEPIFHSKLKTAGAVATAEHKAAPQAQKAAGKGIVSADTLKIYRADISSKRPVASGINLSSEELDKYVAQIPADKKQSEKIRGEAVRSMKDHLCRQMQRIPYESDKIKVQDQPPRKGVLMATPEYLSFKPENDKRVKVKWEEVSPAQILEILESYIKLRENVSAEGLVSKQEQQTQLAKDYLKTAIYCDWFGFFDKAAFYYNKAAATSPEISGELESFIK